MDSKDKIHHIAVSEISPDPAQVRKIFNMDELRALSTSIAEFGILSPLLVRRVEKGYQLIAGERRLRAAIMAGFTHVPCIINRADEEKSAYMALVENLQRQDLDFFEEAAGLARLISLYGATQEEAARRIGKSQSAVANKLRLLRLDRACMERIREAGLSERHARALLRLDSHAVPHALDHIIRYNLSVVETERYINGLTKPSQGRKVTFRHTLFRDVRLFINTVTNALDTVRQGGIDAEMKQEEENGRIVLTITLPKT
ncbi:MAG TPA: ParB/RepB/Spo0J family partition protein [Clostridiales bacterium]|nr:ParB/RepB/Spo0J family partition protein [Clostridiales bacterium]